MDDRVSRYPGRVKLAPVEGQENVYDMVLADEPTTVGTRMNKANLLSDQVATLIGLNTSAVPDDMFNVLATAGDLYVWRRTKSGVIDYPVSVNPNAYQTGSDAQPAGYTLGAVSQLSIVSKNPNEMNQIYNVSYSDSISVSDDGVVSLSGDIITSPFYGISGFPQYLNQNVVGKYCMFDRQSGGAAVPAQGIYFIPSGAVFSWTSSPYLFSVTKAQTVTGYPAIPAGTTIEALGKLGDKSRMQIVSYVGTGTYGKNNRTVLTFKAPPKAVFIQGAYGNYGSAFGVFLRPLEKNTIISANSTKSSTIYGLSVFTYWDESTLSFYAPTAEDQLNYEGGNYTAVAFL